MSSLSQTLSNPNLNTLIEALKLAGFGSALRAMATVKRAQVPVASLYESASVAAVFLPDDAKASVGSRVYARSTSASGPLGELTYDGVGEGVPSSGHFGVSPAGNIVLLAADGYTNIDVYYTPEWLDVFNIVLPVVSNAIAIPAQYLANGGCVLLMEAVGLVGTTIGPKIIQAPSASAASSASARLDLAKLNVKFASGDALTSARIKIGVAPLLNLDVALETEAGLI
jgi:hypothetical protein